MGNDANTTTCLVCGQRLVKNGKTPAGTQRWRCLNCGSSSVRKRADLARRNELREFLQWLLGKQSQQEITNTKTGRSLRRRTSWCWEIEPTLGPVESTYPVVLIDGIYLGSWCLLIAVTEELQVLAWQWCSKESAAAWTALLTRIPAPLVVVCDGGSEFASAARSCWPDTKIQRCVFHVQMNIRRHLTLRPRSQAGKDLLKLSRAISRVVDPDSAIKWQLGLQAWWQQQGHLTKQRSSDGWSSWWTHDRLRKAWLLLSKLSGNGHLFAYVSHGNARTTSPLEDGINNGIRTTLRNHRGMSEAHMKRAAEWFLYTRELTIEHAYALIPTTLTTATLESSAALDETDDSAALVAFYDTTLSAEEGLWNRSGWAGRS
ncbi:IS1249 family transposase [Pseudoclavibacter sp. AY1F1]|uniref:IS1249 family transposase n=1 Tax=Pseudoclavibacter sp. AY1F1 TaxID=2080583 RepID=UPI00215720CA|nr:IS1249 family transposase [Pseudoclavibacter sp. AY1F1]